MAEAHDEGSNLLGRSAVLGWMTDRLGDVRANGAGVVILTGEAGIGKTTLLDHVLATAPDVGTRAVGRCRTQDVDPFSAFLALLSAVLGATVAGELGRDITGVGRLATSSDEVNSRRFKLFADLSERLLETVGDDPTILAVDDVHLGQPPLHDLLRVLIGEVERRRRRHRLLVVLTTRPLPPPHPVASLIADLERRPRVHRFDLEELDEAAITRIVADTAGGAATSSSYIELAQRAARGNPLRAAAAVRVLRQRGIPLTVGAADERTWGELRLPTSLDDPVTAWIHGLDPSLRSDLGRVAVLGLEFRLSDATAVVHDPATLQRAREHGLLDSDGRLVWFAHSLYRDVAYDALDLIERQHTYLTAAVRAQRHHDETAASSLAIGRQLLAAGDLAPREALGRWYRDAGLAALTLTLWSEAARFLEAALLVEPDVMNDDVALHCALGRAYYFAHDFAGAEPALRRAVSLAERHGPEQLWADAVVSLLRMVTASSPDSWRRPADRDAGLTFLASATDPILRSVVLQILAEMQIMAGQVDESHDTADQAISLAETGGDDSALALALYARAFADMTALRILPSIEGTRRALLHARRGGDWFTEGIMLARLSFPLVAAGELPEADQVAISCVDSASLNHEHSNQALGLSVRACTALLRGDLDAAAHHARLASEETRRSSYVLADLFVAPVLILRHVSRSDLPAADRIVADWPNLPRSARDAYRAVIAACAPTQDAPTPETLRPPRRATFISAGFYLAAVDAALLAGRADLVTDAVPLLEQWRSDGLEFPLTYPTSVTRVLAEIVASTGDHADAARLFDHAVALCEHAGAHLELARSLAGWVRATPPRHAAALTRLARLRDLMERIGLAPVLLGGIPDDPLPQPDATDPDWRVVMITDVVDSTRVSKVLGDLAYLDLVLRHHSLVRSQLTHWVGHEFSESGDGLLAWFDTAGDAVRCAVDIQHALDATQAVEPKLQIKVALAGGAPLFHDGRPYGLVLNRAARLVDHAHTGEIIIDDALLVAFADTGLVTRTSLVELKGLGTHRVGVIDVTKGMYQTSERPPPRG